MKTKTYEFDCYVGTFGTLAGWFRLSNGHTIGFSHFGNRVCFVHNCYEGFFSKNGTADFLIGCHVVSVRVHDSSYTVETSLNVKTVAYCSDFVQNPPSVSDLDEAACDAYERQIDAIECLMSF